MRACKRLLVVWTAAWAAFAIKPIRADEIDDQIAALRLRGQQEGWTFTVGRTAASGRPIHELCGLEVPVDWASLARIDDQPVRVALPPAFDWRDVQPAPPVRDQGQCGSCWAFATVAPLEWNILTRDGVLVDLSEQWLVSCNRSNYSCSGGWFAHEYHLATPDRCGDSGAVLESDFPYVAANATCACPYPHRYRIVGWAYVGGPGGVPPADAIKQAIMLYGPVSAAVRVTEPFINYTGGVFNADAPGPVNHGVTLVGWDDRQGANGVWILRNSWGAGWGEDGYMRIEYGCSSVGFGACYIQYGGGFGPRLEVSPATLDFGSIPAGQSGELTFTVRNSGTVPVSGRASALPAPFQFASEASYSLAPGAATQLRVRFCPLLQGMYSARVEFTGADPVYATILGRATGAAAADACTVAPPIGTGTFTASNVGAATDAFATCAPDSQADVWWRFIPAQSGTAFVDTCGSDFDTVVSVYSSCAGNQVACGSSHPSCERAASVSFTAQTGQSYYIRVASRDGTQGNIVLNVSLEASRPVVSGRVTTAEGLPVPGVTLTGLPGPPVTDQTGAYRVEVDYGFAGTVRPQKTAYAFSPPSIRYSAVTADLPFQNYTAVPPSFVLRGCVTDTDGRPVVGVPILGLPNTPVTDSGGWYYAAVPLGFSGNATPTRSGYVFDPPVRTYHDINADLLFESYTAHLATGSVEVHIEPEAAVAAGAAWCIDGGLWHDSGQTVTGLPVGRHVVSYRDVAGWASPPSETVTVGENDVVQIKRVYWQRQCRLTVTLKPDWAGQVLASPPTAANGCYPYGTVVTLSATTLPGFRVGSWTGTDATPATGQKTNTVTLTTDRNVAVNFVHDPFCIYQLVAIADGPGSVEPKRGFYPAGAVVELVARPDPGYQVKCWSGSDNDALPALTARVTMDRQKVVRVSFEPFSDCNGDSISDRLNIATGASADCDGDGVPDECESDSDADGVIDDCQQQTGRAAAPDADRPVANACGAGLLGASHFLLGVLAAMRLARVRS